MAPMARSQPPLPGDLQQISKAHPNSLLRVNPVPNPPSFSRPGPALKLTIRQDIPPTHPHQAITKDDLDQDGEDETTTADEGFPLSKMTSEPVVMGKESESPDKDDKEGPFTCKYCDEIFTNYRTYKGDCFVFMSLP